MLVSAVLRKLEKLEKKKFNNLKSKIFFHKPTDEELAVLDRDTEILVFIEDGLVD